MVRFYLDIHDGAQLARDDEGSEFASLDAAIQGAVLSAGEVGRNKLAKGETSDIIVEMRDEQNQRVCTVTASMKVELHFPPPQGPHP
jgi:predicted regulator of Ras-like GTPase activity (Roadblock/LC7/MglB family)